MGTLSDAKAHADTLGKEELIWTTEDLYFLNDKDTFMRLPLPLHARSWLYKERNHRLKDPLRFHSRCPVSDGLMVRNTLLRAGTTVPDFPKVEVTVQINSIARLYIQDMKYDIDFTLMLDWIDASAVGRSVEELEIKDIFNPDVVLENTLTAVQPLEGSTLRPRIHKIKGGRCVDGRLKKTSRYRVTLTTPDLDLRAFPFDIQTLPIRLKGREHKGLTDGANCQVFPITLVGPEGAEGITSADGLRGYGHTIGAHGDHLSEWRIDSLMGMRSETPDRLYGIDIIVYRDPRHVMWHVFFPCFMVLLFSFSVYSIPIAELNGRLEITSTCLSQ